MPTTKLPANSNRRTVSSASGSYPSSINHNNGAAQMCCEGRQQLWPACCGRAGTSIHLAPTRSSAPLRPAAGSAASAGTVMTRASDRRGDLAPLDQRFHRVGSSDLPAKSKSGDPFGGAAAPHAQGRAAARCVRRFDLRRLTHRRILRRRRQSQQRQPELISHRMRQRCGPRATGRRDADRHSAAGQRNRDKHRDGPRFSRSEPRGELTRGTVEPKHGASSRPRGA